MHVNSALNHRLGGYLILSNKFHLTHIVKIKDTLCPMEKMSECIIVPMFLVLLLENQFTLVSNECGLKSETSARAFGFVLGNYLLVPIHNTQ